MSSNLPYVQVEVTPDSERHWKDLAEGKMTVPWCTTCNKHVWYPKFLCPDCLTPTEWKTLSGEGVVYTFSIVHKGGALGSSSVNFNENGPYVFAYVSLDGGPTIMANVVGDDALDVRIGDRVALIPPPEPVDVGAARFVRV